MHTNNDTTRLDSRQIRAAAQGRWPDILQTLGIGAEHLRNRHGPCPACAGRDRFRFDDKDGSGSFFCNGCGSGDGFRLLQIVHSWSFPEALKAVSGVLGFSDMQEAPPVKTVRPHSQPNSEFSKSNPNPRVHERIRRTWHEARPITENDPAWLYLSNRSRGECAHAACLAHLGAASLALRFHPGIEYFFESRSLSFHPALLAVVRDPVGAVIGLRQTFLTLDGKKANLPQCKKLTTAPFQGAYIGSATRLFPLETDSWLVIAEGLENALVACHLWGFPGWAAGSANALERVILPPPKAAPRILIISDNDATEVGQKAASLLKQRCLDEGREAILILPACEGHDLADLTLNLT